MPFKRRVAKARDPQVTPEMVRVFEAMRRAGGEKRDRLHGDLFDLYMTALSPHPRPWQWPVVQSPREAEEAGERPEALALWHALADASREARAARREAPARNGRLPAA